VTGPGETRHPEGETEMMKLAKLFKNEKGATAIEYGLIAALIAVVCIGAFQAIGSNMSNTLNKVANNVNR
jgi:pilus assembly protein Flp/PilA